MTNTMPRAPITSITLGAVAAVKKIQTLTYYISYVHTACFARYRNCIRIKQIYLLNVNYLAALGRLAPYLERACFLSATPAVSNVPRITW